MLRFSKFVSTDTDSAEEKRKSCFAALFVSSEVTAFHDALNHLIAITMHTEVQLSKHSQPCGSGEYNAFVKFGHECSNIIVLDNYCWQCWVILMGNVIIHIYRHDLAQVISTLSNPSQYYPMQEYRMVTYNYPILHITGNMLLQKWSRVNSLGIWFDFGDLMSEITGLDSKRKADTVFRGIEIIIKWGI